MRGQKMIQDETTGIESGTWLTVRNHSLFATIPDHELKIALNYFEWKSYRTGELLIKEGERDSREVFLVLSGSLEVIKKTNTDPVSTVFGELDQFIVARLGQGDLIGEMSLINDRPRSASIMCISQVECLALHPHQLDRIEQECPLFFGKFMKNLAGYVSSRVEKTTFNEVRALKTELENSMLNAKANLFFSYVIGLLCIYNLTISKISELSFDANKASIISALIIIAFALGLIFMIKQSKLPVHVMGITLRNWKPAVKESVIWSVGIIAVLFAIKWVLISVIPKYQHLALVDFNESSQAFGINFLLYGLHSPIQEFVARGVLQGSLQHFFSGRNVTLRAIIVSTALFSATHVHLMSGWLGIIVFVPGLFWGWLYSRHNSLVGVSVSHIMIGWTGLFFLNIEAFF